MLSKPFIEKMQFILKQGKQAEEQQKKKHVGGDGPVWQPHALYVWLCGRKLVGLRGNLKMCAEGILLL